MPMYEYRAETGEVIERFYRMNDERPETFVEDGVEYRRVYSAVQVDDGRRKGQYPYVSHAIAGTPAAADCKHVDAPVAGGKHTERLPLVESRAHEQRLMGKHGMYKRE